MNNIDGLEHLRSALKADKLVPLVGAGVSMAAAKLPTWRMLIEHGIQYAAACGGCEEEDLIAARDALNSGSLPDAVRQVRALLKAPGVFNDELLNALRRRGVHIHQAVIDGRCKDMLDKLDARSAAGASSMAQKSETKAVENANRILMTLDAILNVSSDAVFGNLVAGSVTDEPLTESLVIVRESGIEVRRLNAPAEQLAWLPSDLRLLDGSVQLLRGQHAVVAFSCESVFAWNPAISTPIAQFSVDDAFGILSVDHWSDGDTLHSVVSTAGEGTVYFLRDMECVSTVDAPPHSFLFDMTVIDDRRVFALLSGGDMTLVRKDGERWRQVLDAGTLEAQIVRLPLLGAHYEQRSKEAAEWFGSLGCPFSVRFEAPDLKRVRFFDRTVLALSVTLVSHVDETIVLFLDPDSDPVTVIGQFVRPDSLSTDFSIIQGRPGEILLVCSLLSDFKLGYDLIVWARGAKTKQGVIFVEEGSTLRTKYNLARLACFNMQLSFAADDSGGLFRFSLEDLSWEEIDRRSSRVAKLTCP
jgi:hypothetical protein